MFEYEIVDGDIIYIMFITAEDRSSAEIVIKNQFPQYTSINFIRCTSYNFLIHLERDGN